MAWARILLTILNKPFWLVSCKDGAPSMYFMCLAIIIDDFTRCTASPEDLEGPSVLRCCEHTAALAEGFELGILWDEYGIVGDIVVCLYLFLIRILFFSRLVPLEHATVMFFPVSRYERHAVCAALH
jgi:hypothetical protein